MLTSNNQKRREVCGHPLATAKTTMNGDINVKPIKIYPYNSMKTTLQQYLMRPGFYNLLGHWKDRKIQENTLADVYDGAIWKSFKAIILEKFQFV
jgi:hypothetical protein